MRPTSGGRRNFDACPVANPGQPALLPGDGRAPWELVAAGMPREKPPLQGRKHPKAQERPPATFAAPRAELRQFTATPRLKVARVGDGSGRSASTSVPASCSEVGRTLRPDLLANQRGAAAAAISARPPNNHDRVQRHRGAIEADWLTTTDALPAQQPLAPPARSARTTSAGVSARKPPRPDPVYPGLGTASTYPFAQSDR